MHYLREDTIRNMLRTAYEKHCSIHHRIDTLKVIVTMLKIDINKLEEEKKDNGMSL